MRPPAPNDETTRRPFQGEVTADVSVVTLLTLLSHPDPSRIGERAALLDLEQSKAAELSRQTPRFSAPGSPWNDRALNDPYLSRKPWRIQGAEGGIELLRGDSQTALRLNGEPVDAVAFVSDGDLTLGVTLELSDRVALLLHRMPETLFTATESEPPDPEMVGAAAGLQHVRSAVERVADLEVPVLIRGESGTGKELVARGLHRRSRRARRPFVAVDLGAMSSTLAAAELFGHAKGAFTGAHTDREGFFRAADGGTLFLDEVGEAGDEVQAMLLRVLETRQVIPVGSHQSVPVDVRLLAATDSDLVARARRGDFKEPLLHRLAAYVVELPPLRERREDLGRLFVHLARPVLQELGEEGRLSPTLAGAPAWLPADLAARLAQQHWSGNVRQLANVVRQLVIDSRGEKQLRTTPSFWARLGDEPAPPLPDSEPKPGPAPESQAGPETQDSEDSEPDTSDSGSRRPSELSDDELLDAMQDCDFEPAAAARQLGVSRPSIYKMVRRHPTLRLAPDIDADELKNTLQQVDGSVADAAAVLCVSKRALGRRLTQLGLHSDTDSEA